MARDRDEAWGTSASPRPLRVAELIRRALADPLQRYASEAGLGLVTLSAVDISPDLREARLYVTQLGPAFTHAAVLERLQRHMGALRARVARELRLRHVPRLSLRFDESLEKGARIDALIAGDGRASADSSASKPETR